jgi:uncharacterized cysteine cluster protein YcgN (CxxCxxCC family)
MSKYKQDHIVEPNKKVSSVEWLESEITKRGPLENNPPQWLKDLYSQAKAMHKEEIKTSMSVAFLDGLRSGDENYKAPHEDWEDYYIKAFDN